MKSLGLAPFVCSEIARQVCLEMKWSITGKATKDGEPGKSPRAEYLAKEFEKCVAMLREKLRPLHPVFAQSQFSTDNAMGVAVLAQRMGGC